MKTMRKTRITARPTLSTEARLKLLKKYSGSISLETVKGMYTEVKKMRRESEVRMKRLEKQWQSYQTKKK